MTKDLYETTGLGSPGNTKQTKLKNKKTTPNYIIFKLKKIKENLKEAKGVEILPIKETKIRIRSDFSQKSCKKEESGVKYLKCFKKKIYPLT